MKSLLVTIDITPGTASASLVSIDSIRACALGAAQKFPLEHSGNHEIAGVLRFAGNLVDAVDAGN